MKRIGIISYNIFCNFTNYGSALQSFALNEAIKNISNKVLNNQIEPVLIPYCPKVHEDSDPLNPFKNMWDKSEKDKQNIDRLMPAIKTNYNKYLSFFAKHFINTKQPKFTKKNFDDIKEENINGFICGADTIFCTKEFGFDDIYFANHPLMQNFFTCSYSASFGASEVDEPFLNQLKTYLPNFKALGIREPELVDFIKSQVSIPVERVLDPTLLLPVENYRQIRDTSTISAKDKYLLLYSRRYNDEMEKIAEELAQKNNWKIIEISLRTENTGNHIMRYDAGVEEFLSLVSNASFVITNSYHGMIFATKFHVPFYVFSREQCDLKILDLLETMGLKNRLLTSGNLAESDLSIDYDSFEDRMKPFIKNSYMFLENELKQFMDYHE
jgi:hypothetical protein